jgi:hypothetical protein
VSSSVTSSDGVIIKFQKQCMKKAIQGKLSRSGLRDMLRERVGISIHNFNMARNKENAAVL